MPVVSPGSTSSAVRVRICFTSFAVSGLPRCFAYDTRRPAAPAACPVHSEPVTPFMSMCACPPYCVRFESRSQVPIGPLRATCGKGGRFTSVLAPSRSATTPFTKIVLLKLVGELWSAVFRSEDTSINATPRSYAYWVAAWANAVVVTAPIAASMTSMPLSAA